MSRLRSNDSCWCGSGRKFKRCHGDHDAFKRPPVAAGVVSAMHPVPPEIVRPDYVGTGRRPRGDAQVFTDPEDLARLRNVCRIAAEVLLEVGGHVTAGITTDELDRIALAAYVSRGSYPSDLGYGTYTKSVCTSVNDVVCHGIPDSRALVEGDIVNIDVTAYLDGFHGDTSATFSVGELDIPTAALVETTRLATLTGIAAIRPGLPTRAIGVAIQRFAEGRGLGVVADYGGHGIGRIFHAAPHISHYDDRDATDTMVPGMVFTVEPMLTAGTAKHRQWPDGWTEATLDGLPTAQFEHTVRVTEDGAEILTVDAAGNSAVGATLPDVERHALR